ncbi:MAG TPA: YqgE/AlgH family protein [Thermoanaerobaculia bacterium]|nr:YqgE/AlgH family protein [Thermoanaerobaculia bacterium]
MDHVFELSAPSLLLAMPQIQDPFFHRGVVLLLAHEEDGSFGLVVNRPSNLRVRDILEDLDIAWGGNAAATAFVGGPVQPQRGTVLFPAEEPLDDDSTEIVPGVAISQSLTSLGLRAPTPSANLRLVLGYAGWSAGQLAGEIMSNDWLVAPASPEAVFSDPALAWERALLSVGIDPNTLPTWTDASSSAN